MSNIFAHLVSLARFAPLVACAGVLATASPAAAQEPPAGTEPAPPSEPSPEAPPAEASPEVAPPPPEGEAAAAGESTVAEGEEGEVGEVVLVTGYGRSLGAALRQKKRTTGQVDAIVAEDIADFPDLNLAESLQRIPGVSISRTYGEGTQITVRGLSGLYTRVRVNGMEARAFGGSNTNIATRGFDFNLFASELFNSIVVHKTASADLDEGSLGSVVDLNTARAFNYEEGFTFAAGATGAYNDLSDTVRPRLTGLVAYRDPGGVWGATASAAYSSSRSDAASAETVRWQRSPFRSVGGVICADNPGDARCSEVAAAQHPRIPRYGEEVNSSDRLGLTAGVQFRPTDKTEVRLDAMYARYTFLNDRKWLEVLFRGNEPNFDITNYRLQSFPQRFGTSNDSLIAADLNNAWVRSERNPIDTNANFYQFTLAVDHWFTDNFYVNALGGMSRSRAKLNDATVDYDIRTYNGFSYDYSNNEAPLLAYRGADVTDATQYQVSELRDRYARTEVGFDTAGLDLHYDIVEQLGLVAGLQYKRATLDTRNQLRDGLVCGLMLYPECNTGNGIFGPPGEAGLSDTVEYPGEVGDGSNTRWVAPQVDAWFDRLGYSNVPLTQDQDGTYSVEEKNLGTFLQAKGEFALGPEGMRLVYDAGVRYVQTRQTSTGYNSEVIVTIDRPMYDDWLPSANFALWTTDDLVFRLAGAQVMTRPSLVNLSPGGTVDSFNYEVEYQNPFLNPTRANVIDLAGEWYFSESSLFAVAVFLKDINSFPIRTSRTGTFASTNLPTSVIQPSSPADMNLEGACGIAEGCWDISELTDGPGATIKGLEVALQAPFKVVSENLPPVLRDMGFLVNLTFVDSEADYTFAVGTTNYPIRERLLNLSNRSANATLYYDDNTFGARLSLAHRSNFLTNGPNSANNLWEYTESDTRLDFSSSYNVNEYLKFSLEALNLLNTPTRTRVDTDAERPNLISHTGRNILLGAQFKY